MAKKDISDTPVMDSPAATVDAPASNTASAPLSSASALFENSRMETKRLLDMQPKKTVRLRGAGKGEPNYETVCVNGYIYQIMRGIEVPVPQTVYDILDEAGII